MKLADFDARHAATSATLLSSLQFIDDETHAAADEVSSWGSITSFHPPLTPMIIVKDTERSCVCRAFDGFVHKQYRGHHARQRLENEVKVLEHLRSRNCLFVPRLIDIDRRGLEIVQTNCGVPVQRLDELRLQQLFDSLLDFDVLHGDRELRNVTYRAADGNFCIVDFELATIVERDLMHQLGLLQSQIDFELSDNL